MGRAWPVVAAALFAAYWTLLVLLSEHVFGDVLWLRGFRSADADLFLGVLAAVLVGALIGRWWALLLAATPACVLLGLESAGYIAPFSEAEPPFSHFRENGGSWFTFWLLAAPLALGVILRKFARRPERVGVPGRP
jgi:hypothetical protein